MPSFPQDAVGERVQRPGVVNLEDGANLQVVLQILAHARAFVDHLDAEPGQPVGLADAGELEELGRVDRPRCHQDLSLGKRPPPHALVPVDHAADLAAFDDQPFGLGLDDDPQVGPLHGRAQEAVGRVPAHAPALVDFEEARTLVVAVVEIGAGLDAEFLRALLHRFEDLPAQALLRDLPAAAGRMHRACSGVMVFGLQKIGQDIVPRPAGIAELAPVVVVRRLTAHVDHSVDRRASAEHLAARIDEASPVEARLGRSLHHPVRARVAHAVQVSDWNADPVVGVAAPGFEQEHAGARVFRQAVRQYAAGGAGAHDDVVVLPVKGLKARHAPPPLSAGP